MNAMMFLSAVGLFAFFTYQEPGPVTHAPIVYQPPENVAVDNTPSLQDKAKEKVVAAIDPWITYAEHEGLQKTVGVAVDQIGAQIDTVVDTKQIVTLVDQTVAAVGIEASKEVSEEEKETKESEESEEADELPPVLVEAEAEDVVGETSTEEIVEDAVLVLETEEQTAEEAPVEEEVSLVEALQAAE